MPRRSQSKSGRLSLAKKERAGYPHLPKAPIVEAIIDFRVRPRENVTAETLRPLRDTLGGEYAFTPARLIRAHFQISEPESSQTSMSHVDVGWRGESQDKLYVVQAQVEGFTFSRLKPYEHWESFRDAARRMWSAYQSVAAPEAVTRIALRYINRIEFKVPIDFDDYLTKAPGLPDNLPQVVSGFLSRVVIPYKSSGIQILITQAMEAPTVPGILPVLLDIDVFLEKTFAVDDEERWRILEELRGLKNDAFFGSVTERTLEMFR